MNLQRTPPINSVKTVPKSITPHHSSDSALNEPDKSDEAHNVTRRYKRRFDDHSECFDNFMSQMKSMFAEFQETQNANLKLINKSINSVRELHLELKKSVEFVTKKYDESLVIIGQLQQENKNTKKQVQLLEHKLELQEKSARASTLEIRHIPKLENETKETLMSVVKALGSTVNLPSPVIEAEIRDIYRTNSKTEAVVVDFTTVARKTSFISKVINFNKNQKELKLPPLNTNHIQIKGPPQNIYISDSLTGKARKLYYLARQCAKARSYDGCWISFGRIYIRKSEGEKPIQIKEEGDLDLNKI